MSFDSSVPYDYGEGNAEETNMLTAGEERQDDGSTLYLNNHFSFAETVNTTAGISGAKANYPMVLFQNYTFISAKKVEK